MADLLDHDATALAAHLRTGAIGAKELLDATQTAIERQAALNAVAWDIPHITPPVRDAPFSGVPIVVKDNEDWPGVPTTHGSLAIPARSAKHMSGFVSNLHDLGFTVVAKTTMPEFGLTASTESPRFGATRNPWDHERSVGGSSGGSAALVASGAAPIGHANDGGGSIRIPASCTGLVGLKPSFGRLTPPDGTESMPVPVVAEGVVTTTVRDTMNVLAALDSYRPDKTLPPITSQAGPSNQRLRIGFFTESFRGTTPTDEVATGVLAAMNLCAQRGHEVIPVERPFADQDAIDFLRYWQLLAASLSRFGGKIFGEGFQRDTLSPLVVDLALRVRPVLAKLPGSIRRLRSYRNRYEAQFDQVDVIASPVLATEPPPIGYLGWDVPPTEQLLRLMRFACYTSFHNVAGAPAISLPLATSSTGLPIGVQFAAPRGQEQRLLDLALGLEEAQSWPRRVALSPSSS